MHAVDSAVCPEIQNHHLAAKIRHGQRFVCVHPLKSIGKLGCIDLARVHSWTHADLLLMLVCISLLAFAIPTEHSELNSLSQDSQRIPVLPDHRYTGHRSILYAIDQNMNSYRELVINALRIASLTAGPPLKANSSTSSRHAAVLSSSRPSRYGSAQ